MYFVGRIPVYNIYQKRTLIIDVPCPSLWTDATEKNERRMKLIKPSEISARIFTLLDESDERVMIVSPYLKISKWYKFINKVNELLGFHYRYIHTGELVHCDTMAGRPAADLKKVMRSIREELKKTEKNSWLWFAENALHICTGRNNYSVSLNEVT